MKRTSTAVFLLLLLTPAVVPARGVSPWLPLNLEPEIERQIERVLILADDPVLTRPLAAARVLDALPRACAIDPVLCAEVRRYLARFAPASGLVLASAEVSAASGADRAVPDRHGLGTESVWNLAAGAYVQPSDYAILSLGAVAYEGEATPTGSLLSVGVSRAQLDVGFRDHWFSPLTDASMLIGTEAATMPSVTLSNYDPLTRLGLRYEAFVAEMSESDRIAWHGGFTRGKPRLTGLHLSAEPVPGWSIGLNRLMQFGGGARGRTSLRDVFDAFFKPASYDNVDASEIDRQFGNQLASISTRFVFPGEPRFAVYFEYAGEDTSRGRSYLLGNAALLGGITVPRLFGRFDLTYEASEWQNAWYVHSIYEDGLTNDGHVLGHWGGDQRLRGDGVGAQAHMLRLGWDPHFGGSFEVKLRTLKNEDYSGVRYVRGYDATLRYSRQLAQLRVGAEVFAGRDVFGEDFSRVAAFFRYAPDASAFRSALDAGPAPRRDARSEMFVLAGASAASVSADLQAGTPRIGSGRVWAPYVAVGARRAAGARHDLGVRLELEEIDDSLLLAVRALDYHYRVAGPFSIGAFVGAARYDLATPAYGMYAGAGLEWRSRARTGWSVSLDVRRAFDVARDHLLPADPQGGRPDSFYDINATTLSVGYRF